MDQMSFCLSCSKPIDLSTGQQKSKDYCEYCSDEHGVLKSREEVQQGIAFWLESWAPEKKGIDFLQRADYYMKSLPAWADA